MIKIMTFWGKIIGNLTSNPCLEKEHFFWDTLYCLIHLSKMLAPNFFCGSWDQFETMGAPDTLICTAKLVASYLLLTKSPPVITCISHSKGKAGLDFDIVCMFRRVICIERK